MATMKAIRKVKAAPGPEATRLEDVPIPVPGQGEALVRVLATAPCGTDRHIYNWDGSVADIVVPPRTYGHEFCGEIAALGPGVGRADLHPGDYVSAEMHVVCDRCRACRSGRRHACENTAILGLHRDGCFAELVAVPAANVIKLDRAVVPPRIGAFLDALGNAVHTTEYTPLRGASVAVLGFGPIGAMAAAVAEHEGAARIFVLDVNPRSIERGEAWKKSRRLASVEVIEITRASDVVAEVKGLNQGGVDVVLEMSGAEPAINQALALARHGGHVSLLGLPRGNAVTLHQYSKDLIFKGLTVQAIIGRRMFETWDRMLALLAGGLDVSHVVSDEYPGLEHFHEGMAHFDRGEAMKIVFYPGGTV
jgi:threonine 3-dehydrogenase